MEIRVEDRMEEAERLLVRWVEVAGGVVSATPGVREARWERKRGENPPRILRWRPSGHRIEVQAASEDWPSATWCSASLDSLEFVLEAAGFDVEKGPSTGCLLTWDPPPSGVSLTRAMDDEMASRGFSRIAEEGGVDCWAVLFGKDGTPEWRVECVVWTRVMVLDVSHVSVPFDATGEREVMTGILRRLGLKP
jgi:hypothetical protein